jgi:DNA-binding GntR family transcriptional regulator
MKEMRSTALVARSLDIQAADVLREEILSGTLAPGSRLLETELSERLNLSRGTIRSALQQLNYEGLVVQYPYRGSAVVGLTAQDAWELYTLRTALEGLAARLAAETLTAAKAKSLGLALEQLQQAAQTQSWKKVTDADFMLHQTIIQCSEHRRLQQQYQIIEQQIRLYIAAGNTLFSNFDDIVKEHQTLVEAICSQDVAIAEKIARGHNPEGQALVDYFRQLETV